MKFSSIVISTCAIAALTGCAYIVPPDQSVPRNNVVIGDPHRPQMNNGSTAPQSDATPARPTQGMARNDALPMLPPVDAATQAQAQQEMAMQSPVVIAVANRMVPTENAPFQMSANTVQPMAYTSPANVAPMQSITTAAPARAEKVQILASNDYPPLTNVPPRPEMTGPDSTKERLNTVRSDLEQDRANAQASKDTLARDAAAEPSMLSQLPSTDALTPSAPSVAAKPVMSPLPVAVVPTPAPAAAVVPVPHVSTIPANVAPVTIAAADPVSVAMANHMPPKTIAVKPLPSFTEATPNVPNFAPPAPLNAASTPTMRVASAAPQPLMRPATESTIAAQDLPAPGVNTAPAAVTPPTVMTTATQNSMPMRPTVGKGDFDPLAAADNAPIVTASLDTASMDTASGRPIAYANNGYMAASRYAGHR